MLLLLLLLALMSPLSLFQKLKVITVGMCTLLFFLLAGSSQTHKVTGAAFMAAVRRCCRNKPLSRVSPQLSVRWSPQAMMYLKGKRESEAWRPSDPSTISITVIILLLILITSTGCVSSTIIIIIVVDVHIVALMLYRVQI